MEHQQERTPIIALTADAMGDIRKICHQSGMDDYMSKPFRVEELQQTITKWLAKIREASKGDDG